MMDDEGVPVIGSMFVRDGWGSTSMHVRGRGRDVFISPEGDRYVRAGDLEHADLIYHRVSKRFTDPLHVRLRLQEGSALAKRQRREQKAAAQADAVDNQRRKARKVRRKK